MKLQLAFDFVTNEQAMAMIDELKNVVDIFEIGTPLIIREGIDFVRKIKNRYPDVIILADLKIMDAGEHETSMAAKAGADIVTVLGVSDNATIKASIAAAHQHKKEILVDMIGVEDINARAKQIDELGADYICIHTAFDIQSTGKNPLEELRIVKKVCGHAKIAVAGGIKLATVGAIVDGHPDLVIVGGGVTGEKNRRAVALQMKKIMNGEKV